MNGRIFDKDKLGLTRTWYVVPKTKELPANYGLAAWEVRSNLKRHADIRIEKNQQEGRARRRSHNGWNRHNNARDETAGQRDS